METTTNNTLRQPIVTVVGHVDHGKTSLLDAIRGTIIAKKEVGGITQKISFTNFPADILKEKCKNLLEKYKINIEIPGFLFIDTPGHAAFTNLRKRGGSLADIAVLVIDINEGIMPQTMEVLSILRENKTPFLIALNKIDKIPGFRQQGTDLKENIEKQAGYTKTEFENKMYSIIGTLSDHKINADIFYKISDFTKQVILLPCSAKTSLGIEELLVFIAGLSQKYLINRLEISNEPKGVILEVIKEKSMLFPEAILYDGMLKEGDRIIIAGLENPVYTKVRAIFEALPLGKGFKPVKEITAATGFRMQVTENSENILAGMPFTTTLSDYAKIIENEVKQSIKLDETGITIKADSLGSLEALIFLLRKENIAIKRAGIGEITKADILFASSQPEQDQVILAFNSEEAPDVSSDKVKIIKSDIIYRLIEEYQKWKEQKLKEIERVKLSGLDFPFKIKVLPYIFRDSKPAIFGVEVLAGKMKSKKVIMDENGEKIDEIKEIQAENKKVEEAERGKQVAISLPNIIFSRNLSKGQILYSDMTEENFRELKKNKFYLTSDELNVLQEIAEIKRKQKITWGI